MSSDTKAPSRSALLAFVGAAFIGGTNFVAVKFSNEELDPFFGAALRFGLAALLLWGITAVARLPLPRGRSLLGALLYGLLGFGVSYALLYFALVEQGLPAGVMSVIVASVPLITLGLAVAHGQERFSARGVLGGLLAMAGIALLSARALGGDIPPIYLIAALLGAICIAESSVIIKGFPRAHPVTTNAVGMSAGVVFLVVMSLVFDERWALPQTGRTWFVLVWLVVAGSVGLFMLYLFVIARWTASATNYALTLMPVVAVALAALVADEPVTIELLAGGVLVIVAVYVAALSQRDRDTRIEIPEPAVVAPQTGTGS